MISVNKSLFSGILFLAIALFFGFSSLYMDIGTAFQMGPGYFPLLISGFVGTLALIIIFDGLRKSEWVREAISLRGLFFVLGAPVAFALVVKGAGLIPATVVLVIFGLMAENGFRPREVLFVTACLVLTVVVVFHWGLGVMLPLFGPWLALR